MDIKFLLASAGGIGLALASKVVASKTPLFFDDFDYTSIDELKKVWTVDLGTWHGGGTISFENGKIVMKNAPVIKFGYVDMPARSIEFTMSSSTGNGIGISFKKGNKEYVVTEGYYGVHGWKVSYINYTDSIGKQYVPSRIPIKNELVKYHIDFTNNNIVLYRNEELVFSEDIVPGNIKYIAFGGNVSTLKIDYLRIMRK